MATPHQPLIEKIDVQHDLLDIAAASPEHYPFLLESVAHGTPQGRFDVLFAFPESAIESDGQTVPSFLERLQVAWTDSARPNIDCPLPFHGGWFVYLGYELAGEIEPSLNLPDFDARWPQALAVRCPAALIRDRQRGCLYAVAEAGRESLFKALTTDAQRARKQADVGHIVVSGLNEDAGDEFLQSVRRIKDYILAGDVFQVNISRQWQARCSSTDEALYRALRDSNPAPFAAMMRWSDAALISSSPERLVTSRMGKVETRPIAGTRPRNQLAAGRYDQSKDRRSRRELIGHPKERAEHIMLIDLERNDLGRVCKPGTIEVDELMVVESYAHVHHIVSNVSGQLRDGASPVDVIRAVFPGGTITGCPKVRCMEIIAELEGVGRGPYTGSLGYLNLDGSMDMNILIRSLLKSGQHLSFRAGAGIVADSDPEHELAETRSKARGLLLALRARAA